MAITLSIDGTNNRESPVTAEKYCADIRQERGEEFYRGHVHIRNVYAGNGESTLDISGIPIGAVIENAHVAMNARGNGEYSDFFYIDKVKIRETDMLFTDSNIIAYLNSPGRGSEIHVDFVAKCADTSFDVINPDTVDYGWVGVQIPWYITRCQIEVTYTEPDDSTVSYGVNNSWQKCKAYYGVNGEWKPVKAHYGADGEWKPVK